MNRVERKKIAAALLQAANVLEGTAHHPGPGHDYDDPSGERKRTIPHRIKLILNEYEDYGVITRRESKLIQEFVTKTLSGRRR